MGVRVRKNEDCGKLVIGANRVKLLRRFMDVTSQPIEGRVMTKTPDNL